jgi:hypothetical protein
MLRNGTLLNDDKWITNHRCLFDLREGESGVRKERSWQGEIYQGDKRRRIIPLKTGKFVALPSRPA